MSTSTAPQIIPRDRGKWIKGHSGNPTGRPRLGHALAELLRAKIDKPRFVQKLLELAYAGNLEAAKLVLAYTEGQPSRQAPYPPPNRYQGDLSKLSDSELRQLRDLIVKMEGGEVPGRRPDVFTMPEPEPEPDLPRLPEIIEMMPVEDSGCKQE